MSENNSKESAAIQTLQPPQYSNKEKDPAEITTLLDDADILMEYDSVSTYDRNKNVIVLMQYVYKIMSSVYRKLPEVAPILDNKI